MTAPSAKRPKFVEEERLLSGQECVEDHRERRLNEVRMLDFNQNDAFEDAMVAWGHRLVQHRTSRITLVKLKKMALKVAYLHDIVFDTLPVNWVPHLIKKCKLVIIKSRLSRREILPKKIRGPLPEKKVAQICTEIEISQE